MPAAAAQLLLIVLAWLGQAGMAQAQTAITVSPCCLADGLVGESYNEVLSATGGIEPYHFSIGTGSLPPGLTISDGGAITGTPTAEGSYGFTALVMDATESIGSRNYTIDVFVPPSIIPATLSDAVVGKAYGRQLSVENGDGEYTFSISAGALPPGFFITPDGRLGGIAESAGTFNFEVSALPGFFDGITEGVDAETFTATAVFGAITSSYTLVVVPGVTLAPATLPDGAIGMAYAQPVTAGGGVAPYDIHLAGGALPPGLSITATGPDSASLEGTPTSAGDYSFVLAATDANGDSITHAYAMSIAAPVITISPPTLPDATAQVPYNAMFSASGGTAPYTFTIDSAPPGLALAADGTLGGTPSEVGSSSFSVTATDALGATGTQAYVFVVEAPTITLSPAVLPDGAMGSAYAQDLVAGGGTAPYDIHLYSGSLPPGLALVATGEDSARLEGTPTSDGDYAFQLGAMDANGFYVIQSYDVSIVAPVITISPTAVPDATAQVPYSAMFSASGGTAPYTFTIDSAPPGLALAADGTFGGTPSEVGSSSFSVTATDALGATGTQAYVLVVEAPTITLSPAVLPDGTMGSAYAQDLVAGGGTAPYDIHLYSGSLPPGLALVATGEDSARLEGTPTSDGDYAFQLGAMDANGFYVIQSYDVSIVAPVITISPPTLPDARAQVPYSAMFSASGGTAPYTFTIDSAPPGLALAADGTFGGTPGEVGSSSFSVTATDALGATGTQAYVFVVEAPTITLSPASLPGATLGAAYAQAISASGGTAPYSFALIDGSLPPGLALAADGTLAGTPAAEGDFAFSVRATDVHGFDGSADYALAVLANAPVAVDDVASTPSRQTVVIEVTANDSGDIDAIAIATAPAHGTAAVDGLSVTYTPAGTYFGDDSFTYTASGPGGASAPATVSVYVSPLPVPVGVPQSLQVLAGGSVAFDAAQGASGGPITGLHIVQPPLQGSATVAGTVVTYTAPAEGSGTQSIGYVLSNAYGDSAPVVSTIAIDARPVAPELHATTPMGIAVELDLTAGASGGPFVDASIQDVHPSGAGTAMLLDDGDGGFRLRFTPDRSFTGEATVGFTLSNAHATSAPGSASIEVTERDDPTLDPQVGGIIQAQVFTVREFVQAQINNVQNRLEELHDPGNRKWGFWIGGTLRHGDRNGNGAVAPASFETSGLTSGADYRFSDRFAFGAALGHARDRTAVGNEGGRSDGRAESAMGYGSFKPGSLPFYLDGMAGHQRITFQLQRADPATGEVISVPRDGVQSYSSWAGGYEHKAETWKLATYGRMDVSQARLDAYQEPGDPLQALAFDEMAIQTRVSTLGVRGRFRREIRWGTLEPKFRIEFQRDFHDASGAVIRYADQDDGPAYVLPGDGIDRSRAIIEVGGVLRTFGGMILRLELRSVRGGPNDNDNAISFSLQDDH